MKKIVPILLIFSTMVISCATIDKTSSSTTRVMDIYGAGVIQHPVIGEMDVDIEKVTGKIERDGIVSNIEPLRILAINDAIQSIGADVLVEPTFEVVIENGVTTVTATGYPAVYTGFRPVTSADVPLLQVGQLQKAEVYEVKSERLEENSPSKKVVLGILGVIGVGALIISQQ